MATTPPNKQVIDCPACRGKLRAPASDEYVRLRCPHCGHQFSLGIPEAEVLEDAIPEAEVISNGSEPNMAAGAPGIGTASADGGGQGGGAFSIGEKIFLFAAVGLLFIVVNAIAWFVKPKQQVVVVDSGQAGLAVAEDHYYVDEAYLFGSPAMVMRWFGAQSPRRIRTAHGDVVVAAIAEPDGANRMIVVNRTANDIFYSPVVYGEESTLPAGLDTDMTRIPADAGAAVLDKTHGEIRFGCAAQPRDVENFRSRKLTAQPYSILAWVTAQDPASCGPVNPQGE